MLLAKGNVPASILDKLVRATNSIPLNLAEVASRWGRTDKQWTHSICQSPPTHHETGANPQKDDQTMFDLYAAVRNLPQDALSVS